MNKNELTEYYRSMCLVHSAYDVVYSTLLQAQAHAERSHRTKKYVLTEVTRFVENSHGYDGATEAHKIYLQARVHVRQTHWRTQP